MKKNNLIYIHNNHTACILENIQLPRDSKIQQIKKLSDFKVNSNSNNLIMFGLSGDIEKRDKEEKLVQEVLKLNKKCHPTFIIITPFSFEAHTNLSYVFKQLNLFKQFKIDFEILELDELLKKAPHLTFSQAYKEIQEQLEVICSVKFECFKGQGIYKLTFLWNNFKVNDFLNFVYFNATMKLQK